MKLTVLYKNYENDVITMAHYNGYETKRACKKDMTEIGYIVVEVASDSDIEKIKNNQIVSDVKEKYYDWFRLVTTK